MVRERSGPWVGSSLGPDGLFVHLSLGKSKIHFGAWAHFRWLRAQLFRPLAPFFVVLVLIDSALRPPHARFRIRPLAHKMGGVRNLDLICLPPQPLDTSFLLSISRANGNRIAHLNSRSTPLSRAIASAPLNFKSKSIEALVPAPTPAGCLDAHPTPSSGNSDVAQQSNFGICHNVISHRPNTANGQSSRSLARIYRATAALREVVVGKLLEVMGIKTLVPKKGLEPPHPCGYMDLNHARLPIPPLRQVAAAAPQASRRSFRKLLSSYGLPTRVKPSR